jgi:acyl-coenzyme A thioesterase PaaI-like protein
VDYCIRELEKFYAIAKVMRLGGRIASVRMELLNDADLLIATGTAAYVVS